MPVPPFEPVTRGEFHTAFVVLPDLMVFGFPWLTAQRPLLENVAFRIAIQFQKARLLIAVPPVRQDYQYLSFLHTNGRRGFGTGRAESTLLNNSCAEIIGGSSLE